MALLNPYIAFRGTAREALEFYQSVFGGELDISTFGAFGMPGITEDLADNVMHGQLTTASGFTLMASDTPPGMPYQEGTVITISLSGAEEDELRGYWAGLAEGGEVGMPLEQAPWGDTFGQLTDRFGINWMVNIAGQGAPAEG